ncbi:MAG: ABC transporter permease [Deltaproteobacteria bacterium]|nr:ABC transporter permease [Deltaproteobacteria bacterium]
MSSVIRRLLSTRRAKLSIVALLLIGLMALCAPLLPEPSAARSLALGARGLILIGASAAILSIAVGAAAGASAAYTGGLWDGLVTRLVEVLTVFPGIMLVALLRALDPHPSTWTWIASLAMVRVAEVARLTRAEVLRLSGEEFVQAARAMGASPVRILWHHMGPHLAAALAQSAVFTVGALVVIDAAMSLLGLGASPSAFSWGGSIASAVSASRPGSALVPATALVFTVLALSWLADAVREALDPYRVSSTPLRQRPTGSR